MDYLIGESNRGLIVGHGQLATYISRDMRLKTLIPIPSILSVCNETEKSVDVQEVLDRSLLMAPRGRPGTREHSKKGY